MSTPRTPNTLPEAGPATSPDGICRTCGLPTLLCACRSLDADTTLLRIRTETRRYGKAVTVVGPFASPSEADRLATLLKRALATGGTHKGLEVELQGDLAKRVRPVLEKEGFLLEA